MPRKKNILLVDDEELTLKSLTNNLTATGYDVTTAKNGFEACAVIDGNHIDLVITDLIMEGIDGIEVLKHSKKTKPDISVIILTGYGGLSSAIEALRLGADDYMLKPCDTDELRLRLARSFEKINLLEKLKEQNIYLSEEIGARKKAEEALATINRDLETRVKIRTTELEETNIALKVLLKQNEQNKNEMEKQIVGNVRELVEPILDKLKKDGINDHQKVYVDVLAENLEKIISPFLANVTTRTLKFTPMEIQVASIIRLGRTTKEISELLNISPATVDVHRKKIRKKLGITNQKVNLRTVLTNMS